MSDEVRNKVVSESNLKFAQDLIKTELPLGIFDDYTNENPQVIYQAWILTNNDVNLWSAQFMETSENEQFMEVESLFMQALFTKEKIALYYDFDNGFSLFNVEEDNPEKSTIELRKFDETKRLYPQIKFNREDVVICQSNLAFSRWTYTFFENLKLAKLYDLAFITTLAESKKFWIELNTDDSAYQQEFLKHFYNNDPFIKVRTILTNKGGVPDSVKPLEMGTPSAHLVFEQLLKFQAFKSEMLGITQATDTKAERLTAGENVINVNNVNLINAYILRRLKLIALKIKKKFGISLTFDYATTLTPGLYNGNTPLTNGEQGEVIVNEDV